jgi:hypothetical protein
MNTNKQIRYAGDNEYCCIAIPTTVRNYFYFLILQNRNTFENSIHYAKQSLCLIKLHTMKTCGEWRYSSMHS